jgi:homoserine kinase
MAPVRRIIRVPASIGNLGPGFDTLGLAVSLYLRVTVRRRIDDGQGRLVTRFAQDRPVAQNGIARAFGTWPFRIARAPSLEVDVDSEIPERAGLGSSAAAAIAGLRLRELCDGPRSADEILATAARLEQHPDNASAVMFGGLTSSRVGDDGRVTVARWRWPAAWTLVIATPHVQLATSDSRRVIPAKLPLADVIFNLQRLALLLHAVQTRSAREMAAALEDRCHQPYREPLVPVFRRALALRHPDVLGVCLSGAGPSVVAIARRNAGSVERALADLYRSEGVACTTRIRRVHQ